MKQLKHSLLLTTLRTLTTPARPAPTTHSRLPPTTHSPPESQARLRYANNPTELIIRIHQLAQRDTPTTSLDLATQLVKSSSVRVATISVWTELFKLLLKHKRFASSYKLFLEIKRRNIDIDLKFFHFYFYFISQSPRGTKNYTLERLKAIWSQAQSAMRKNQSTLDRSMVVSLNSSYLNCLCCHGFTDEAFKLFRSLPSTSIDSSTIHQISRSLTSTPEDLDRARALVDQFSTSTLSSSPSSSFTSVANSPQVSTTQIDLRTTLHLASLFFKSNNQPIDQQFGAKILEERLGIQIETNQYQYWNKTKPPITVINPNKNNDNNNEEGEEGQVIKFNPGQFTTLLRMLLKIKKYSLIRRLWYQIIANRDLYLQRNSLDQTHCGLVMIAMSKCKAMSEVESLLIWMIKSGDKRLRPTLDTLDKAVQAAWETCEPTSGIIILSSLTQRYDDALIRPGTSDSEHELIKLSREYGGYLRPIEPVSNRTLCTILQTAGRMGTTLEINRALLVVECFDRKLPIKKSPTQIQLEHQEKEKGLFLMDPYNEKDQVITHLNDPNINIKNLLEIEKYWYEQYIWVLTDLLDKLLSRNDAYKIIDPNQNNGRVEKLTTWRRDIDNFLANNDSIQFSQLRSRIEVRANQRLLNKQQKLQLPSNPKF